MTAWELRERLRETQDPQEKINILYAYLINQEERLERLEGLVHDLIRGPGRGAW